MTVCQLKSEQHVDRMLAYAAGRLNADAAEQLNGHMDVCSECAAFRESQSGVWSALDSWEAPPVSADFNRRLYAKIEAADAAPWYTRWLDAIRPAFALPAIPLAAAAAVVVAGFLLDHPALDHRAKAVTSAARQAAVQQTVVSATDAEQVEKTLDDLEMLRQFDVSSDQNSEDKEKTSKSM